MMLVCIDANVFISHLLKPTALGPPNRVVTAAISGEFELILIETTIDEVIRKIRSKPYLAARIPIQSVLSLMSAVRSAGTVLPETLDHLPTLTRDPGDDYLIAHAIQHKVEILVSGDHDLLVLGEFEGIRIVSPAAFVGILEAQRDTDIS